MPKSSAGVRALREQAMWRVLASFARTRLSQAEFCRREGVPLSTFLYWRRRLTGNPAGVAPFVGVLPAGMQFRPVRCRRAPAAVAGAGRGPVHLDRGAWPGSRTGVSTARRGDRRWFDRVLGRGAIRDQAVAAEATASM